MAKIRKEINMTENNVKFEIIYDEDINFTDEEIEYFANEYEIEQKDGIENA